MIPSHSFPKAFRLQRRSAFSRVEGSGEKFFGGAIFLLFYKKRGGETRLGVTVTKKYGKAHDRNRFKRLVKEAFRLLRHTFPPSMDIVVKPRKQGAEPSLSLVMEDFRRLVALYQESHSSC